MLETERLLLRHFTEKDTDAVFAMRSDAETMRFIREPQKAQGETWKWLQLVSNEWETKKIGFCAVIEKNSDLLIGWCGLWRLKETHEIEIGYAIASKFRKNGFAFEASVAMLEYGFSELSLEEIVAVAHPENVASRNVMKKLGMTLNGKGKFYGRELVHYSISKTNWLTQSLKSLV